MLMKNNEKEQAKINESNLTSHEKEEFEKLCRILSDPNYSSGSWALPKNPTLLDKSKYDLCKKILVYKQKNHLSTEKMAKKIKLSVPETEDILYCHIDYFTFDRLLNYAGKLFSPSEIRVVVEEKNKLHA
jgi:hypothetical protein